MELPNPPKLVRFVVKNSLMGMVIGWLLASFAGVRDIQIAYEVPRAPTPMEANP